MMERFCDRCPDDVRLDRIEYLLDQIASFIGTLPPSEEGHKLQTEIVNYGKDFRHCPNHQIDRTQE